MVMAITEASAATPSEVRPPYRTCAKMLYPWSVVPSGYSQDGAWRGSESGSFGRVARQERRREITATTMTASRTIPNRDFGFASRNRIGSGTRRLLPVGRRRSTGQDDGWLVHPLRHQFLSADGHLDRTLGSRTT